MTFATCFVVLSAVGDNGIIGVDVYVFEQERDVESLSRERDGRSVFSVLPYCVGLSFKRGDRGNAVGMVNNYARTVL